MIQTLLVHEAHCENHWTGDWAKNFELIPAGWGWLIKHFACLGFNLQAYDSYGFYKTFSFIVHFLPFLKPLSLPNYYQFYSSPRQNGFPPNSHINYYNSPISKTGEHGYLIISPSSYSQNLLASEHHTKPLNLLFRDKIIKIHKSVCWGHVCNQSSGFHTEEISLTFSGLGLHQWPLR